VSETKDTEHFRELKMPSRFPVFRVAKDLASLRVTRAGGRTPPTTTLPLLQPARFKRSLRSRLSGAREELSRGALWKL
jgi:hypothetical protein